MKRSLPFKVRTLAIGEISKWPLFGAGNKLLTNRVLQYVIGLFTTALIMPQPVFKEITLPNNTQFFGRPFFPLENNGFKTFFRGWKGYQCVQMVGHEQK